MKGKHHFDGIILWVIVHVTMNWHKSNIKLLLAWGQDPPWSVANNNRNFDFPITLDHQAIVVKVIRMVKCDLDQVDHFGLQYGLIF